MSVVMLCSGQDYVIANSSGLIVYDGGPSSTMAYATALYFTLSCLSARTKILWLLERLQMTLLLCPGLGRQLVDYSVLYDECWLWQRLGVHRG